MKQNFLEKYERDNGINQEEDYTEAKWITKNLIVKITDKNLSDGEYYKVKGRVKNYEGLWALVEIESSGDVIKIHQKFLSTVVPVIFFRVTNRISDGRL